MSREFSRTLPDSFLAKPQMESTIVVLPAPLAPSRPTTSPAFMLNAKSRTTVDDPRMALSASTSRTCSLM